MTKARDLLDTFPLAPALAVIVALVGGVVVVFNALDPGPDSLTFEGYALVLGGFLAGVGIYAGGRNVKHIGK